MDLGMDIDIQPAGTALQLPRYVRERPKPGLCGSIIRMLGIGAKPKRRLARVDQIPCPFAFAIVPGSQAESALDDLVRLKPDRSPVILGTPEAAASMFENASHPAPIESLLVELDRFDLDGWLAERFAELKRVQIEPPRGPWPSAPRRTADDQLSSVRAVLGTRNFLPEVVIALVPSAEPALAALHLGYGDWNDCPSPIVHAAMARRWARQYGALPVAYAGDVVEFRVVHPIAAREQALTLALEYFAFCPDGVLQGTETIERLAAWLIGAPYWLLWWD